MLRHLCRSLAWTSVQPQNLLLDTRPESSLLFKQFPELRAFRDISTWCVPNENLGQASPKSTNRS